MWFGKGWGCIWGATRGESRGTCTRGRGRRAGLRRWSSETAFGRVFFLLVRCGQRLEAARMRSEKRMGAFKPLLLPLA